MKKAIPTIISLISVPLSMLSIQYALLGYFSLSIMMILICVIVDFLDGFAAKKLNAVSVFGGEIDSLCDSFSFGIAPTVCVYFWLLITMNAFGIIICSILIAALIMRLARFNSFGIQNITEYKNINLKDYFLGVPAPLFGILILAPIAALDLISTSSCDITIDEECMDYFENLRTSRMFQLVIYLYYITISYLAISCIKIKSLKNIKLHPITMCLLCVAILYCIISYPMRTVLFVSIAGLIYVISKLLFRKK